MHSLVSLFSLSLAHSQSTMIECLRGVGVGVSLDKNGCFNLETQSQMDVPPKAKVGWDLDILAGV